MEQLMDIERVAPGVSDLSPEELDALQKFRLLWTIFEAQVLDNAASVRKIREKVTAQEARKLEGGWFLEYLEYFSNRSVENGQVGDRFRHLHLRKNDDPELVKSVVLGANKEPRDQLIACLTIVYRFRNNFFHGLKWAYGIREQLDNFNHAANLLKKCLEKF